MTSELPEPLHVLAVGAHPDDVEIAIGGTLARLVRQGYRVGMVDLTDGEPTPGSPGPEVRLQEAATAARILGVQVRETLDLPNRHPPGPQSGIFAPSGPPVPPAAAYDCPLQPSAPPADCHASPAENRPTGQPARPGPR